MRPIKPILALLLALIFFDSTAFGRASTEGFAVYGRIVVLAQGQTNAQSQMAAKSQASVSLFTVKLYFPKEKGRPTLLAYPDASGNFNFPNLTPGSYLLEVSLSEQLLYQRILKLESDILLAIPVGGLILVDKATIAQSASQPLTGSTFNRRVTIKIGSIKGPMQPNRSPFSLSIYQGTRRLFAGTLTPPMLVAMFSYNNQRYTLAGALRMASNTYVVDCEVYQ